MSDSQGGTQQSKESHPSRKCSGSTSHLWRALSPFEPHCPCSSISVALFRTGSHSHRKQARAQAEPHTSYTVICLLDTISLRPCQPQAPLACLAQLCKPSSELREAQVRLAHCTSPHSYCLTYEPPRRASHQKPAAEALPSASSSLNWPLQGQVKCRPGRFSPGWALAGQSANPPRSLLSVILWVNGGSGCAFVSFGSELPSTPGPVAGQFAVTEGTHSARQMNQISLRR